MTQKKYPDEERSNSHCLECGDPISYGRKDRKFCCRQCRYDYHNNTLRQFRFQKARTLSTLERNYAILEGLCSKGIEEISLLELCKMGYMPAYMTSMVRLKGHLECTLFDIHFRQSDSKLSCITKVSLYLPSKSREP